MELLHPRGAERANFQEDSIPKTEELQLNGDLKKAYEKLLQQGAWKTDCAAQPAARPAEQDKGPDWLFSSSIAQNFTKEMNYYLQEMSVCQK